mmetsp:Transcript_98736/g.274770  ORF Transcript_98736/g.274770 Transcript_98736/m.274770 type:complete len:217 (+) Transcript_98736:781-1431(+)
MLNGEDLVTSRGHARPYPGFLLACWRTKRTALRGLAAAPFARPRSPICRGDRPLPQALGAVHVLCLPLAHSLPKGQAQGLVHQLALLCGPQRCPLPQEGIRGAHQGGLSQQWLGERRADIALCLPVCELEVAAHGPAISIQDVHPAGDARYAEGVLLMILRNGHLLWPPVSIRRGLDGVLWLTLTHSTACRARGLWRWSTPLGSGIRQGNSSCRPT